LKPRPVQKEDLKSFLYLNSDLAAKVTGVTIPVDAGHLILTPFNATPTK
jgi:hypothetical protein